MTAADQTTPKSAPSYHNARSQPSSDDDDDKYKHEEEEIEWRGHQNAEDERALERAKKIGTVAATIGVGSSLVGVTASIVGICVSRDELVTRLSTKYKNMFGALLGVWLALLLGQGALWWQVRYRAESHSPKLVTRLKISYLIAVGGALLIPIVLAIAWRNSLHGKDHATKLLIIVFEAIVYLTGTVVSAVEYCEYSNKLGRTRSHKATVPSDTQQLVRRLSDVGRNRVATIRSKAQSLRSSRGSVRSQTSRGVDASDSRLSEEVGGRRSSISRTHPQVSRGTPKIDSKTLTAAASPTDWETTSDTSESDDHGRMLRPPLRATSRKSKSTDKVPQASTLVPKDQRPKRTKTTTSQWPQTSDRYELFLPPSSTASTPRRGLAAVPAPSRSTPAQRSDPIAAVDSELFFSQLPLSTRYDPSNAPPPELPTASSPSRRDTSDPQKKYVAYSPSRAAALSSSSTTRPPPGPEHPTSLRPPTSSPETARRAPSSASSSRRPPQTIDLDRSDSSRSDDDTSSDDSDDKDRGRLTPRRGSLRVVNQTH